MILAIQRERKFSQDLQQKIEIQHGEIVFNADNDGLIISVDLYNGGVETPISGSVAGAVICPDGSTVGLQGTSSGNTASITLKSDSVAMPGQIGVGIQIVDGTTKTTVFKGIFDVELFETNNPVDPGSRTALQIGDLIAAIDDAIESIPPDYSALVQEVDDLTSGLSNNNLNYTSHIHPRAIKDDGTWVSGSTTYAHMIFNVIAGDEISVTAPSGYYTSIACLRSYNISSSGGDVVDFSEDENWTGQVRVAAGNTFNGIVPDDALYFYVLLQTSPNYVRMPTSIKINGYEYMVTLQKNLETVLPVVDYPKSIRIMQYNCGMWSMGNHESMTAENFPVKMDNYKKFLCKYKADVVGIQEWVEELTIGNETKNINTILFNPIYPYKNDYIYTGSAKGRALKSKWVLTDIVTGSINGNLFDSSSNCLYCLSHINYYGRSVALLTTAIVPTSQSAANVTSRSKLMPLLFDLIKSEEYAFLICDVNNVGDGANISITDEGDSINAIAEQNGFTGSMGSYYPWTDTYKSYATPHKYGAIDNIFYRNNGKTLFVDYTIPMDEYDNLFSDHIPCIGDFILL